MDCFYIITNKLKDKDYAITSQIEQYIQSSGKKCFLSEKDSEGHIIPGTVSKEAESGLVLGGDGTLIRAVRDLGERSLPLLGINLGTLGYLTDVDLEDFESALDHLFSETPVIEERMMLEASLDGRVIDYALNEALISRGAAVRMLEFRLDCDGTAAATYRADGLILSTPTGSTAYAMSAGGPIVDPRLDAFAACPVCPHAFAAARALVFSPESVLTATVAAAEPDKILLTCDGRTVAELQSGDCVSVRRAALRTRLIRIKKDAFYQTLYKKFNAGRSI